MNHSPQTPHALFKAEPFPPFLMRRSQLQWLIALSDRELVSVTLELGLSKSVIGLFSEVRCQIMVVGTKTPSSDCLSS